MTDGVQAAGDEAQISRRHMWAISALKASSHQEAWCRPLFSHLYIVPSELNANQWALAGTWAVDPEKAAHCGARQDCLPFLCSRSAPRARPRHGWKTGPFSRATRWARFSGRNHRADTDASGSGIIREQRLYQLIRQSGEVGAHVFSIEFLDSDVQAYSFTFG